MKESSHRGVSCTAWILRPYRRSTCGSQANGVEGKQPQPDDCCMPAGPCTVLGWGHRASPRPKR